jgi:hypothetical protein
MSVLRVSDVRAAMPRPPQAPPPAPRTGPVLGVVVHHSATAHASTGLALDTAQTIFDYHVHGHGWPYGGYHYLIRPTGLIEYALDEAVPGLHAGFHDPTDALGLEHGQFWNAHYLAVCLLGWFETDRVVEGRAVPNYFTRPTAAQWTALLALLADLRARHSVPVANVRGHRELAGCHTRCPGALIDLDALRAELDV